MEMPADGAMGRRADSEMEPAGTVVRDQLCVEMREEEEAGVREAQRRPGLDVKRATHTAEFVDSSRDRMSFSTRSKVSTNRFVCRL